MCRLEFAAEPVEFALMKGHVRIFQNALLAGLLAGD